MRARDAALLVALFAAGCLVPAYEADLPSDGGGSAGAASGNSAIAGTSGSSTGAGTAGADGEDCTATQKSCAGQCVEIDDPTYGCTPSSCDMAACPLPGEGKLACAAGACVVGACGAGQKKCDGKCGSVDDPTYGCGTTSCDASACPAADGGTIVCNAGVCETGACSAETKECDGKCVPRDRNYGCDAETCETCEPVFDCRGNPRPDSPTTCTCIPEVDCAGRSCGTYTDRCGRVLHCPDFCTEAKPNCDDAGQCVECIEDKDCPGRPSAPCAWPTCTNNKCSLEIAPPSTPCSNGFCSTSVLGLCELAGPVSAGGVSIDATEVTRYQYQQFVQATGGAVSGQPAYCSWNTSVMPASEAPQPIDYNKPVVWVDWCDAYAYCKHVGRRLCGKVGGGANPSVDYDKPAASQWMRACTGATNFAFPYGDDHRTVCHETRDSYGDELDDTGADVATFPLCEGGYDGLWDMSGNVHEWEDSCVGTSGTGDACRLRGGSFWENDYVGDQLRCDANRTASRATVNAYVGFRCCGP